MLVIDMNKLRELRMLHNYSYSDMATFCSISKTYYWQIENKKRRLSYDLAVKIAKIFNLKPDDIFYEES